MTLTFLALAGALAAGLVTAFGTPLVRRAALHRGWVDHPDGGRKAHASPTASVGGLAIVAGVVAGLGLVLWAAPRMSLSGAPFPPSAYVGALLLVGVGWYDDVRGLGFKSKLAAQVVVAALLVATGVRLDLGLSGTHVSLIAGPLSVLWIVGVINAVNLVDGVDGLAAGVAAIAFGSMALAFGLAGGTVLVLVAMVFVGALLGFLVHNFAPASIFMGDSGSLFLGYGLAVYSLSSPLGGDLRMELVVPVLALGLPLLDTALSMVRRGIGRKAICAPDRDHIHHRMEDRMPKRRAVLVLYAIAMLFGALSLLASLSTWTSLTAAVVAAACIVIGLLARLGYVRLPYSPPKLTAAGVESMEVRPEVSPALGRPAGDGAVGDPALAPPAPPRTKTAGRRVSFPTKGADTPATAGGSLLGGSAP